MEKTVKAMSNSNYDVNDVADWFLSKKSMTPKKLQKMIYYAYSWVLTLENEKITEINNKLFNEKIEAWVHGPVIPSLYRKYKEYGYSEIPAKKETNVEFTEDINNILEQVWDVYGDYTGNELESMTHQEAPWINAREGLSVLEPSTKEIKDKDIFKYYLAEMFDQQIND